MNYKKRPFKFFFTIVFIFSTALIACRKEAVTPNSTGEIAVSATNSSLSGNGNSPAAHIEASENLTIPSIVSIPENFPNGNTRVATFFAVGVQKYKARVKAGSDPVIYEWVFVAPQADLYNINNNKVGNHGAGPFWTTSTLDSIFGQQFVPARTAPSEDPESIDWLLLMPKAGNTPKGIFADVDYIQRIATKGGKAPLTLPTNINETVEVKYKAVYRFTKINP